MMILLASFSSHIIEFTRETQDRGYELVIRILLENEIAMAR